MSKTVHQIRLDQARRLAAQPGKGHNRWHEAIPAVVEVMPGEEVELETRDAFDGQITPATVAEDLRQALSRNPALKIFFANGYFDFATPFFETEYTVGHMGIDPSLAKNLQWGYYQSGHMIYLHPEALTEMKTDLARFYESTAGH